MKPRLSLKRVYFKAFPVMMVLFCCTAKKIKEEKPVPEKTAFYTFAALRDTIKNTTVFRVLKVTVVNTKINYRVEFDKAKNPNSLKIEITDPHKTITAYTDHPLFKKFDLYGDSGEIKSKLISLPKAEVTLRVPYFEEYKTIKITETINFKTSNPIILKHEK